MHQVVPDKRFLINRLLHAVPDLFVVGKETCVCTMKRLLPERFHVGPEIHVCEEQRVKRNLAETFDEGPMTDARAEAVSTARKRAPPDDVPDTQCV